MALQPGYRERGGVYVLSNKARERIRHSRPASRLMSSAPKIPTTKVVPRTALARLPARARCYCGRISVIDPERLRQDGEAALDSKISIVELDAGEAIRAWERPIGHVRMPAFYADGPPG